MFPRALPGSNYHNITSGLGATDAVALWAYQKAGEYDRLRRAKQTKKTPQEFFRDAYAAQYGTDASKARGAWDRFQEEYTRISTQSPTFDVAPKGSAGQQSVQSAATAARSAATSYADYMREAKLWLQVAKMPDAQIQKYLSTGGTALKNAVSSAKVTLKTKLMQHCGDSAQSADQRIAAGPTQVRSRLSTCAAASAVRQAAQAQSAAAAAATTSSSSADQQKLNDAEKELQRCAGMTAAETQALRAKGPTFLFGTLYNKCQRKSSVPTTATPDPMRTPPQPTGPYIVPSTQTADEDGFPWHLAMMGGAGVLGIGVLAALLLRKKKKA